MRNNKPIMLVEDDQIDVMSVKRALQELNVTNTLNVVGDGLEALEFLRDPANASPCIILLDLQMPRMGGIEFLQVIKHDDVLKSIPVVVLTTSDEDQDKVASFKLSVAGYIIKPVDYRQFVEAMRTIRLHWTLSELPD